MEYKGIITGIGDKENETNLIQPEYDALINDFIIGKNTILEGLELSGKNLSAGTCILCGYRGIMEKNITVDYTNYIYGMFSISFGREGRQDEFNIWSTSEPLTNYPVNPTQITEAGTYALLLYENGVKSSYLDTEHPYPVNSQFSAETEKVLDYAEIAETVTTPTDINELEEVITDLHETQPNRVANTEYVHAQIEREVDYDSVMFTIQGHNVNGNAVSYGAIRLYRKARQVIGVVYTPNTPNAVGMGNPQEFQLPNGFYPKEDVYAFFNARYYLAASGTIHRLKIDTSGKMTTTPIGDVSADNYIAESTFGYQCE